MSWASAIARPVLTIGEDQGRDGSYKAAVPALNGSRSDFIVLISLIETDPTMKAKVALILLLLTRLPSITNALADDFEAMPGLWKTTLSIGESSRHDPTYIQWHCVDEGADPWIAFARLPVLPHESCTRKGFVRTDTSLKWHLDCTGEFSITHQGSLVFDSARHYTGRVELTGTVMGYPVEEVLRVEGERRAACTSPQD
jgi:hypothetical protein